MTSSLFRLLKTLIFFLLLVPSVVFAGPEEAYQKAKREYQQLQGSEAQQKYRENWLKVIDAFTAVARSSANHPKVADALYMAGRTSEGLANRSYRADDKRRAIAFYDQLSERFPASSLADDGLMLAGMLYESMGDQVGAYIRYQRIEIDYPQGDMVRKARERLARIQIVPQGVEAASQAPVVPLPSVPEPAPEPPQEQAPALPPVEVAPGTPVLQAAPPGSGAKVTGIRYWSNPQYTRVVIDLDRKAEYEKVFLQEDPAKNLPARLFVDIANADIDTAIPNPLQINDGLLQRIRSGHPKPGTTRVVIDLGSIDKHNTFSLNGPFRIVFDIYGKREESISAPLPQIIAPVTPPPVAAPSGPDVITGILDTAPEEASKVPSIQGGGSGALRRIVVDAGHGGRDPGAVGKGGTLEKDVVLAMALELKRQLVKEIGCEVVLTRDRDVFIPLEERTAIANKVGADLFISLHANASTSRKATGVETYYLNFSKNDKAIEVVARENDTSLKEVGDLELILFDLMANAKINESSRLAGQIQEQLVSRLRKKYDKIRDLGVRQGPFYVLLGATMPSVLVETAFISNPREEERLKEKNYQKITATAITEAVKQYRDSLERVSMR